MAYDRNHRVTYATSTVGYDRTATETVALADGVSVSKTVSRSDFNKLLGTALGSIEDLGNSAGEAGRAFRALGEGLGPPEEIVELAERRSAELEIGVSCERHLVGDRLAWQVVVRTRRGSASCEPFLSAKQVSELSRSLALVTSWKNAFTQLGLL